MAGQSNGRSGSSPYMMVSLALGLAVTASAMAFYLHDDPLSWVMNHLGLDRKTDESSKKQSTDNDDKDEFNAPFHASSLSDSHTKPKINQEDMTEKDVVSMLKKICAIQEKTKLFLEKLVEEIAEKSLSLEQIYNQIKAETPEDPLVADGISMETFDYLLAKFESSDDVKSLIDCIMGNAVLDDLTPAAKSLAPEKLVDIHRFMSAKLRTVVEDSKKLVEANPQLYESRYLTMTGQALVGAYVFLEFQFHPQEIEAALLLNYASLQYSPDFLKVSSQIHAMLGELHAITEQN